MELEAVDILQEEPVVLTAAINREDQVVLKGINRRQPVVPEAAILLEDLVAQKEVILPEVLEDQAVDTL
jgi:UDP-N-acetylmuramate-alanine ligase